MARKIIEQDLSVRATERMVKLSAEPRHAAHGKIASQRNHEDANVRAAENKLRRHFGTQVRITQISGADGGKIELAFYNSPDLERLYDLLMKTA
jgi:ParB-like chromosome segregation protein Spo0J